MVWMTFDMKISMLQSGSHDPVVTLVLCVKSQAHSVLWFMVFHLIITEVIRS